MSATLWRACLDFSTPENALSDSGSVALTPISAYTFTLPCAAAMRERTMRLRVHTTRRKYVIVRKCNPLTELGHPLETPTCYIRTHACPLAAWLGGISDILHCCYGLLCCDDFMVNKPARRKTPVHFPPKERKGYDSLLERFFFHGFTLFSQAFNFPSFQETFVSSCASISLQSGQSLFEMQCSSATDFTEYSDSQLAAIT